MHVHDIVWIDYNCPSRRRHRSEATNLKWQELVFRGEGYKRSLSAYFG